MMRVFVFLLLACLCATVALAELPCVSRDDAVVVIQSRESDLIQAPGLSLMAGHEDLYWQITCPPGKRVGLWIASAEPVRPPPMKIVGCEVGLVVETRGQVVEGFMIRGAKVGVCWRGDDGALRETHIEATEIGIVGKASIRLHKIPHAPLWGIEKYREDDAACTCPGAV